MSIAATNGGGGPTGRFRVSKTLIGALGVGLVAHAGALMLLDVDVAPREAVAPRPAFVTLVQSASREGNLLVSEQLEYLNPEPLFMPTDWNAGDQPLPAELRRQPDQAFLPFEPQMTFSYNKLEPVFSPPNVAFSEPLRALDLGGLPRFSSVGRQELRPGSLEREGYIEIRRVSDGGIALAGPLGSMPAVTKDVQWAPIQFLVAVNDAGLVGAPLVEMGSGNTEIDDQIQRYLEGTYRLGNRLTPGFYRVTVGP